MKSTTRHDRHDPYCIRERRPRTRLGGWLAHLIHGYSGYCHVCRPTCRIVDVDGIAVRILGDKAMSAEYAAAIGEVVRAAKRRMLEDETS